MTTSPRTRRTLSAVFVVVALTACSSGDKTPAAPTSTTPSAAAPSGPPAASGQELARSAVARTSARKSYPFTPTHAVGPLTWRVFFATPEVPP